MNELLRFERSLWERGLRLVAGVDEVGMGPLAGPVVSAAVILPTGTRLTGIRDSKKLSHLQRDELAQVIKAQAISIGIGLAEVAEIDRINIYHAGLLAMTRAVRQLSCRPDYVLTDARFLPDISCPQRGIVRGDSKSQSIAAASIIAKVLRDGIMKIYDRLYPLYGFGKNKGYPTKEHQLALRKNGPCPIHRSSFASVSEFAGHGSQEFYRLSKAVKEATSLRQCKILEKEIGTAAQKMTSYETRKIKILLRRAFDRTAPVVENPSRPYVLQKEI